MLIIFQFLDNFYNLDPDPDPGGNLNTDPYGSGSSKKVRLRIRLRIRLHNTGSDTYAFICTYIQPGAPPPPLRTRMSLVLTKFSCEGQLLSGNGVERTATWPLGQKLIPDCVI